MCERFTLNADLSELSEAFPFDRATFAYEPRKNNTPTSQIAVIVSEEGERRLEEHRWGLIPFWAKDAVNADSELVPDKPAYRRLFAKHRCLIPYSAFYGWKREGKREQPILIGLRHKKLFAVAGLYEIWKDPRGGEFRTCTVLTTPTNRMLENYNVKLPAILDERGMAVWSNPKETDIELLHSVLQPYHADLMFAYPVIDRSGRIPSEQEEGSEPVGKYAFIKK
ncbi:SOS response-associated peptidase [Paenibacillus filicis]|uniref:Abasic site processing protein n=1 Tax=Paenibacillus gyeongsangnamensis TaxID=3388067 RepID=A0ABT4QGJ3_9BACL|nr:SOS response-associated peptidase [Paenibacillus filicis]MCZ8516012.1 SOS response-associated peptidase [Paenibacillus filicis]